jgi:hypothetical protein
MTAPPDLVECGNCKRWFAAAAPDEVFYHATCACRREEAAGTPASLSESAEAR